jgi:hypothetical protein
MDGRQEISFVVTTRSRQTITFASREGQNRPQLVIRTKPAPNPPGYGIQDIQD